MSSSENVLICAFGEDTPAEPRGRAGPEVHGGPEGSYEKDRSTGRWRSVSRGGTVRQRSTKHDPEDGIVPGTRRAFDAALDYKGPVAGEALQKESCDDDNEADAQHSEEVARLRQQAAAARSETQRLWQALTEVVSDCAQVSQLRRSGQLSRLQAEADFETHRRDQVWQLLKDGLDMASFSALTRKATGCENEKTLSIGAGVRLFEKSADSAQDAAGYPSGPGASRAATPSKLRRNPSRSSLASGRAASNTRARAREPASSKSTLPARTLFGNMAKLEADADQLRGRLMKEMKDTQVGKETAPSAQKTTLSRSDSVVRMRIRDLEPKAASGGA